MEFHALHWELNQKLKMIERQAVMLQKRDLTLIARIKAKKAEMKGKKLCNGSKYPSEASFWIGSTAERLM